MADSMVSEDSAATPQSGMSSNGGEDVAMETDYTPVPEVLVTREPEQEMGSEGLETTGSGTEGSGTTGSGCEGLGITGSQTLGLGEKPEPMPTGWNEAQQLLELQVNDTSRQFGENTADLNNGEETQESEPTQSKTTSSVTTTQGDHWNKGHETGDKLRGFNWRTSWSQRDTAMYRGGYKGRMEGTGTKNLEFYTNKRCCQPDNMLIDDIHELWMGKYTLLEHRHGFIQWLFPIRERGLNWEAQELNQTEIEDICANKEAHCRVLKSYKLMLDFYGMKLVSEQTGKIERSDNWKDRFNNLNYSMHNYLRITRILKCLGELNFEHLKAPFISFVLHEAILERTLHRTLDSCMNYWVEVIMDDKKRQELKDLAQHLKKEAKNRKDKEKDKQKEERQKARQTKADKHKTYSLT